MAIINNDPFTTPQNVSISGSYMTFGSDRLLLQKVGADYVLKGNCSVYKDQNAKNNGFKALSIFSVSTTLSSGQLSNNLYTKLYDQLKLTYQNSTDI